MRQFAWLALLAGVLAAAAAPAQAVPVTATWKLNASTLQNQIPPPPTITNTPQLLSPGTPPVMSIFNYANGPSAQRLFAGTTGWVAGTVNANRFVQFEVGPTAGNQLAITNVTFQYGAAAGAPNRMRSEVRYSHNNGPWLPLGPVLNYPAATLNTFTASVPSLPALQPGQKFRLRIHPYAVVSQTAMSPLFAGHSGVLINGNSTPLNAAPDLQVTKTCTNQGQANQGVYCTILVKNNGTVPTVAPLTLTDTPTAPAGSLFTGGGGTLPISCSPGAGPVLPITCNPINVSIPPLGTATATFSFQLPASGGTMTNCATVTQAGTESNMSNNTHCSKVSVTAVGGGGNPDLQVVKSCVAQANQAVLCTVTVTNTSATTTSVSPLTLTDLPTGPSGSLYTGAGGTLNPSCGGPGPLAPITCTSSVGIPPNQSRTVLLSFKLPTTGGTLNNCATATQATSPGSMPEANTANNSNCTSVVVSPAGGADLAVGKNCAVIGPNRLVRCTITVTNSGSTASPAPWNLTDTITGLAPGATLVSVGAGGIACSGVSLPMPMPGTMNCQLHNPLQPNVPQVILVDFTMSQGGTFANCATVSQTGPETNLSNNNACIKIGVQ